MTPLEKFQSTHTNHLGQPLTVDNDLGPQTRWALELDNHVRARRLVVERALSHIGVCEQPMGSNRGKDIDFWLDRCGVPVPKDPSTPAPDNAWCAAFASWCLTAGGVVVAKARVVELIKLFPVVPFEQLAPADLGYILHEDGTGHVWMVLGREGDLTLNVEGNTNNAVRATLRARAQYVRTFNPATMPGIPPKPPIPMAGSATR